MKVVPINLKYVLLPGKYPSDLENQGLHDRAFIFWKNFWNAVLKENGTDHEVSADDFWRQDMVSVIMNSNEIIGLHLYSFFHTESIAAQEHSYMKKSFNLEYVQKLKKNMTNTLMSMEYFSVAPGYRKKDIGFSLASVLIGLACEHQKRFGIDALVGPSRSDNNVTQLTIDWGGVIVVGGLEMHNTPVDLMAIFKENAKSHPDSTVNKYVKKLWAERVDLTNIQIPEKIKKAI